MTRSGVSPPRSRDASVRWEPVYKNRGRKRRRARGRSGRSGRGPDSPRRAVDAVGSGRGAARWNYRDRGHLGDLGRYEDMAPRLERISIGVAEIARRSRPRRGAKVRSASADAEARRAPRSVGRRSPGCRPTAERPAGRIHGARALQNVRLRRDETQEGATRREHDSPSTPTAGTRSTRRPTNCWRTARCSYKPTRSWPICLRQSDDLAGKPPVPIVSSCRDCCRRSSAGARCMRRRSRQR